MWTLIKHKVKRFHQSLVYLFVFNRQSLGRGTSLTVQGVVVGRTEFFWATQRKEELPRGGGREG